ncbi:MAG: DUF1289 domain-containing protein [Pseudomonadota bacterium]
MRYVKDSVPPVIEEHDVAVFGTAPSPCVRECCLDEQNVCMGCFRSLKEICAWHEAPDAEKIDILIRCRSRYTQRCGR